MNLSINKNMDRLTNLLEKHYELPDEMKRFIDRLSENEDEKDVLTLIAYSVKECAANDVIITKCSSKLLFVKLLKEATGIHLKDAKDIVDKIVSVDEHLHLTPHLFKLDEPINGFNMTKEILDYVSSKMNADDKQIFEYHILTENDKKLLEDRGVSLQISQ